MARFTDTLSVINSFLRTLLGLFLGGLLAYGGWLGYSTYREHDLALERKQQELDRVQQALDSATGEIDKLSTQVAAQQEEIDRLQTAMRLARVEHRIARLWVTHQETSAETGELSTTLRFVEVSESGDPVDAPRTFTIRGDLVYIDYWVVKFEDKYVEQAELDRSTSICLFRRLFGEFQEPSEGFALDEVGQAPKVYARGEQLSAFEQRIWDDFWNIANDPQHAQELGIRAAHGEAVSTQLRQGNTYQLTLRASGGMTIVPLDESASAARLQ